MGRAEAGVQQKGGWVYQIIDIFASEYGWTKDYILNNVYLDEVFSLVEVIKERKTNETLLHLAIAHNPYTKDPNALYKSILGQDERDEILDKVGLQRLKGKLMKESKLIKIKNGDR